MSLRHTYTLFAPIYDLAIGRASEGLRRDNLRRLDVTQGDVLLAGIGTGLDIPHLPHGPCYIGLDLTPAMLRRAQRRSRDRDDVRLHLGDAMQLPYRDASFDAVVLHLILAVVPQPERLLAEAERVLRPGGRILIVDKFLRPGQRAPLRRLLNLFTRHVATRTDVVLEDVLACCTQLHLHLDEPVLARGWFRRIELVKR
ncbi:MAG: phosphatidylethanolamine N-methyltransferase [Gammaproteobacteria bacterium HGW-Gammaproteobacteria-1]|jgi:ubiquinone/menaquinone biosynthesis C-methylase UbiE|nr:MAG: phosphatidylethanolamine N-methyltransferase [Gammaproteobacteria bacterium HGW-Gammaproteobacteria-1]